MSDFVVERGIPLPAPKSGGHKGRGMLYRWDTLAPGESVVVPSWAAACAGRAWAHRNGRSFVVRKLTGAARGWRVWRES